MNRFFCLLTACIALLLGGGAQPAAAQTDAAPLRLDLNIPTQRLVVYEGDRVAAVYPVSVGVPGHDTPDGSFAIQHAEWNPWWRPPAREWARDKKAAPPGLDNPMGRVKLFFEPLYFIHGTPDSENIGRPASHGCIRMLNSDVVELARLLHERVGASVPSSAIDGILRNPRTTRRSDFRQSVPFVIRYVPVVVEEGQVRVYPDFYRRRALHTESVYQALLVAGYDTRTLSLTRAQQLLDRAKATKGVYSEAVEQVLGM